jgi:hypothetical protein
VAGLVGAGTTTAAPDFAGAAGVERNDASAPIPTAVMMTAGTDRRMRDQ